MKRILTAIDFSDVTASVLEETARMAALMEADVRIVHTSPLPAPSIAYGGYMPYPSTRIVGGEAASGETSSRPRTENRLGAIREDLANLGVEAECIELEGPSAELILEEAKRYKADLIIIGTHRHGLFYYLLVGSIRDSVLREAHCPVLVVPAKQE